jgi:hypothetical protein
VRVPAASACPGPRVCLMARLGLPRSRQYHQPHRHRVRDHGFMITKTFAPENGVKPFAIMKIRFCNPTTTAYTEHAEDRWMLSLATAEGSGPVPDIPRR